MPASFSWFFNFLWRNKFYLTKCAYFNHYSFSVVIWFIFLEVVLFTVLWFKWSVKKHCAAKVLLALWETFWHQYNYNYNSYKFSYKFAFIPLLSFLRNQKQESNFQQVSCLVTTNTIASCLKWVKISFKAMANSIDFCKGIFWQAVPVCMTVP